MKKLLPSIVILLLASACGSNVFQAVADPDPAEEATVALDEHKSDRAIEILEKALAKEPENWLYVSLLASAKAQKAGVDTTDLALEMAKGGKGEAESGNALTALFAVLPAATAEGLELLTEASQMLASIPSDQREEGDTFKISMFSTALTALQAKYYDADGDGSFSIEELQNLDDTAAAAILSSLLNAESASTLYQSAGGTGDATAAVAKIRSKIDAQDGASQAEKLRNFLGTRAEATDAGSTPAP